MRIIPELLPEELLEGYRGRLRFLNMKRDGEAVTAALNGMHLGKGPSNPDRELSFVELAAKHNGCSAHQVVMQHSLWPFTAAVDRPRAPAEVEQLMHTPAGRTAVMRAVRQQAWLCPDCVEEDLGFWGVSYWRRGHQLPGAMWCEKHQTALHPASRNAIQQGPPDHCMPVPEAPDLAWVESLQSNAVVQRFVGICANILDSAPVLDRAHCARAVVAKAIRTGICGHPDDVSGALSDLAREQLPQEWRANVFPKINWSQTGPIPMIDAVCRVQHYPASAVPIAFVSSLIFDSADEALVTLSRSAAAIEREAISTPLQRVVRP
jgi:hypothetical protein